MKDRASPWALVLACVAAWSPGVARAALTSPVDGLETALNQAWSAQPECRDLLLDDLVGHEDTLLLTSTRPLLLLLSRQAHTAPTCTARGWQVALAGVADERAAACARVVCQQIDADPALAARLETALDRSRHILEHVTDPPQLWAPPGPTLMSVAWLSSCLATLALWGVLTLLSMRAVRSLGGLSRLGWAALIAVTVAGLIVRSAASHQTLAQDEETSWGNDSFWRDFDGGEIVINPPLYRALLLPVTAWSHGDPMVGRQVAVLLGGLLILVVGRLGFLLGGRRVGLAAASLAAVHPGLVATATYHRTYVLLMLATASTIASVAFAIRSGRSVLRYLVAAAAAATVLSHYLGAAVVVGVAVWIIAADRSRWRSWVGPLALFLLLIAPYLPCFLIGASSKTSPETLAAGADRVLRFSASGLRVIGGFLLPPVMGEMYPAMPWSEMAVPALVTLAAVCAGAWAVPRWARAGLVALVFAIYLLPVLLSFRMNGVREFQLVGAAIPAILCLVAPLGLSHRRGVAAFVALAGVLLLNQYIRMIPVNWAPPLPEQDLGSILKADPRAAPTVVWRGMGRNSVAFSMEAGLTRQTADLETGGRDPRIRFLRSCSTSAMRDVGATLPPGPFRIAVLGDGCGAAELSGRGVTCAPFSRLAPQLLVGTCEVAPDVARRPLKFPQLQQLWEPRLAGYQQGFLEALAQSVAREAPAGSGLALDSAAYENNHVRYVFRLGSELVGVRAQPRMEGPAVRSTEVFLEPFGDSIPVPVLESLRQKVTEKLTPTVWVELFSAPDSGYLPEPPHLVREIPMWWILVLPPVLALLILELLREWERRASQKSPVRDSDRLESAEVA